MDRFTTLAAFVILGMVAVAIGAMRTVRPRAAATPDIESIELAGRPFRGEPLDDRFIDLLGTRAAVFRAYDWQLPAPVWTFVAWFDRPRDGSQVHSPRNCYPGSGWAVLSESAPEAPWGNGRIRRLIVSDGRTKRVVDYWFQRDDGILTSVFELKRRMIVDALRRRPGSMVFVRVSTPVAGSPADAVARLARADRELYMRTRTALAAPGGTSIENPVGNR